MKRLVLGSLVVVGAAQVGCTTSSAAHIAATWSFKSLQTGPTGCPAGFDTAQIVSQELDANLNFFGPPIIDVFNCSDMSGVTAGLPASWFEVSVWITSGVASCPGPACYAESAGFFVDVTTVDKQVNVPPILTDGGYFHLRWDLVGASTGAPVTCAQSNAASVEAISTEVNTPSNSVSDIFNCDNGVTADIGAGEGFTAGILAGNYTVSIDALNSQMQAVTSQATVLTNEPIVAPDGITDLSAGGPIHLPISGL